MSIDVVVHLDLQSLKVHFWRNAQLSYHIPSQISETIFMSPTRLIRDECKPNVNMYDYFLLVLSDRVPPEAREAVYFIVDVLC
jgi:hypothetical protein